MAPTPAQISVALDAVRRQATDWAERATELGELSQEVGSYAYTSLQAGLFFGFVDEYNQLITQLESRLLEGQLAMKEIARTLNTVAGVYEDEERARTHAINNLY